MIAKKHTLSIVIGTALAMPLAVGINTVNTEPVYAQGLKKKFKNFGNKIKRGGKKIDRGLKKGGGKRIIQGIGGGLIAYGIIDGSPAAAIIGVTLVAAPEIFKKDIAKNYGDELNWSGCTRCNKKRIVAQPGLDVSKDQRNVINARVKEDVKDIQSALKRLGYYKIAVDGDYGPGTRRGVSRFQESIGARQTAYLSAEQRHLLFKEAEEKGFTRKAALDHIEGTIAKPVPAALFVPVASNAAIGSPNIELDGGTGPGEPAPMIAEFKLAQSQFNKFTDEFLKSGEQAVVTNAALLPDGRIELQVKNLSTNGEETLIGTIGDVKFKPHRLAEEWVQIFYDTGDISKTRTLLNTRDDFETVDAANVWTRKAHQRVRILAELTGVELGETTEAPLLAGGNSNGQSSQQETNKDNQNVEGNQTAAAEIAPVKITPKLGDSLAGPDGRIVITDSRSGGAIRTDSLEPEDQPTASGSNSATHGESASTIKIKPLATENQDEPEKPKITVKSGDRKAGPDGSIVIGNEEDNNTNQQTVSDSATIPETTAGFRETQPVSFSAEASAEILEERITGFETSTGEKICRQNVYVSFKFPVEAEKINHYNIVPPEGTIMMDNGDSTAYFLGPCVQGQYKFSYVYVEEAQKAEDWKHFKREGTFQIASNGEHCSIDLGTSDGSSNIECY